LISLKNSHAVHARGLSPGRSNVTFSIAEHPFAKLSPKPPRYAAGGIDPSLHPATELINKQP
jgi:hypothetical protein